MNFYVETSVVVSALSGEPRAAEMRRWLRDVDIASTSDWVTAEVSAAFSMKVRMGIFDPATQQRALAVFAQMQANLFQKIAFLPQFFGAAARFADRHATGLRAGDALHLAICEHGKTILCTLDKRLAQAGSQLGVETLLL